MPALHMAHAANIVDASLATAAFVASTAPMRCRFMTANGTGTAAGTELAASNGYTGGTGAPTVGFGAASTTTGTTSNSGAVTVANMPGTAVNGVEVWDSSPARKWYGALSAPKTVALGDTFTIAAGSLTVTLS